jgi:hypothetical protein
MIKSYNRIERIKGSIAEVKAEGVGLGELAVAWGPHWWGVASTAAVQRVTAVRRLW